MPRTRAASPPGSRHTDEFERLFLEAEYDACRALLASLTQSDTIAILLSRVDLREGHHVEAVGRLSALTVAHPRTRAARDLYLGFAHACTKDFDSAHRLLDRALGALQAPDTLYYQAVRRKAQVAWMQRDFDAIAPLVRPALASPDANDRAQAHSLISWSYGSRGDVQAQISELLLTIDEFERAPRADARLRLDAFFTLAALARELPRADLAARVRSEYDTMLPTSGTALQYFKLTRLLGYIDALQGDELAAFRRFRAAMQMAPSDHFRVLCMIDRALLARAAREPAFALDQLYAAHDLASRISWNDAQDEDRMALVNLAQLFADEDPAIAQRYLAQFRSLGTPMDPRMGFTGDDRVRAFEAYSSGTAMLHLGETAAARDMLLAAWEIFERFNYGWRAAQCAFGLYCLESDGQWLTRAVDRIKPWPNSWIAREIAQAAGKDESGRDEALLSAAQRPVFRLVLEGKRNAQIAKELDRSPNTVRNHIAQIFKRVGVRSRSELIARLKRF